jgi:hypothetical protein
MEPFKKKMTSLTKSKVIEFAIKVDATIVSNAFKTLLASGNIANVDICVFIF